MPYKDLPDWQVIVAQKHLIFDADAIISLISFQAEDVFEKLQKLGATFHYINPVLLELMSTDSSREKLQRTTVLAKYGFAELPMTATEMLHASRIQRSLPIGIKGKPSPTDYYLGGTLAKYANSNAYLLTSNTKDFPLPIFTREAIIPLFNQTDFKAVSIVGLDSAKLLSD